MVIKFPKRPHNAFSALSPLESLLIEVAICAPLRQTRFTQEARIPWALVHRIRTMLDEYKLDWRAVHTMMLDIERKHREEKRVQGVSRSALPDAGAGLDIIPGGGQDGA